MGPSESNHDSTTYAHREGGGIHAETENTDRVATLDEGRAAHFFDCQARMPQPNSGFGSLSRSARVASSGEICS